MGMVSLLSGHAHVQLPPAVQKTHEEHREQRIEERDEQYVRIFPGDEELGERDGKAETKKCLKALSLLTESVIADDLVQMRADFRQRVQTREGRVQTHENKISHVLTQYTSAYEEAMMIAEVKAPLAGPAVLRRLVSVASTLVAVPVFVSTDGPRGGAVP